MSKPKKTKMTGFYTSMTHEGTVQVTVPADVRLPNGFKLHIKGERDKKYFFLVKQKVVKND